MIKEIKSIPLASFLSRLGHEPAVRKGTRLWYKSPLRQEHTPSFKVETALNCWYDFGLGRGGNIINLAAELYQSNDLRYLMRCIADRYPVPSVPTVASSFAPRHSAPSMEQFEVVPLEHRALVAYLQERGIPAHIATANCKEAHYSVNSKPYFAVAFENVSGGWELRNRYFKGCWGRKDISYLPWARDGPSTECAVFEGFIDYLSALTLGIISGADTIILNSLAEMKPKIQAAMYRCKSWDEFRRRLAPAGINVEFYNDHDTGKPQGIRFSDGKFTFNGSKIDRAFSYRRLDKFFAKNAGIKEAQPQRQQPVSVTAKVKEPPMSNVVENIIETGCQAVGGLFQVGPGYDPEEAFIRAMKKKPKKKKGRSL